MVNTKIKNEFMKFCERQCLSKVRIFKYEYLFKEINMLKINLNNLSIKETDKFFFYLKNSNYTGWTMVNKKAVGCNFENNVRGGMVE